MNKREPIDWVWFTNSKGCVGIVKIKTQDGSTEYRISAVDGFMEKMDVQQVIAWGSSFPASAGRALFGAEDE